MKHAAIWKKQSEKIVETKQKSSPKIQKKTARAVENINFVKTAKNLKFAPTGVVKKTKEAAAKKKVAVSAQILKPKKEKAKIVAVAAEPKSKTAKKVIAPVSAKKANKKEIAAIVPVKKVRLKPQKIVAPVKPKLEKTKVKPVVAAPKIELKKKKVIASAATRNVAPKAKEVEVTKPEPKAKNAKAIVPIVKSQTNISKSKSSIADGKSKIGKIQTAEKKVQSKKTSTVAEKSIKSKKEEKETVKSVAVPQKIKLVEPKVEAESLPVKTKPKKTKPIGAAVFRGRRERYDFQVYPLDAVFDNVSAIYIISKRKTDRLKKGHHALVCIGQTDSVAGELKKHTKSKCVKKYAANVISILPEANEKRRLKIEEDLKAAHSTACNIG